MYFLLWRSLPGLLTNAAQGWASAELLHNIFLCFPCLRRVILVWFRAFMLPAFQPCFYLVGCNCLYVLPVVSATRRLHVIPILLSFDASNEHCICVVCAYVAHVHLIRIRPVTEPQGPLLHWMSGVSMHQHVASLRHILQCGSAGVTRFECSDRAVLAVEVSSPSYYRVVILGQGVRVVWSAGVRVFCLRAYRAHCVGGSCFPSVSTH
jgi:hypothetical protein